MQHAAPHEGPKRPFSRDRVAAAVAVATALTGACSEPPQQPDVLLITLDTVRADHLASYGGTVPTPVLDSLAAEGLLFENATTPLPETRPAHYTIFTSRYPAEHGVVANSAPQPLEPPVALAGVLGENGFDTAGFAGCALFDDTIGTQLGFAHFDAPTEPQRTAEEVVERFLAWEPDAGKPFFAWVHLFDAHMPYAPPPPFDRSLEAQASEWPTVDWPALFEAAGRSDGALSASTLDRARSLYAGEVEYLDYWVGRLLQGLEDRGRLDQTIVVVTSDHGECFSDGVYFEHSSCLADGALRVPLLVRYPGATEPGRRIAPRVELLDIAPTVLRLAGVPIPDGFGGRDLLARAAGNPASSLAFFQFPAYTPLEVEQRTDRNRQIRSVGGDPVRPIEPDLGAIGVYAGDWKYTLRGEEGTLERTAGDAPDDLRLEMRARLHEILTEWARSGGAGTRSDGTIDPELAERLRALGYLSNVPQRP